MPAHPQHQRTPTLGAVPRPLTAPAPATLAEDELVLAEVRRALAALQFGSVTLIVQNGRVVQVETTRKLRLVSSGTGGRRGG